VVGEEPLREELRRAGFAVLEDPSRTGWKVDYVVAAFDRTFDYAKLNHALQAIRRGARFVATNPDRTCPVDEGEVREIPDCAGMIGAIEGVNDPGGGRRSGGDEAGLRARDDSGAGLGAAVRAGRRATLSAWMPG
jgi:ribonucleotide monophosphatase NagD (HAD superfamily)